MSTFAHSPTASRSLLAKVQDIAWTVPLVAALIAMTGVAALYSTAGGHFEPWAERHAVRASVGLTLMLTTALVPLRWWMRLANPLYLAVLAMLIAIPVAGTAQMGARRWLGAGDVSLQPSEFMKVALVLALARYYQWLGPDRVSRPLWVAWPLIMIGGPVMLVLKQPDLGTAMLILTAGLGVVFLAGVRPFYFVLGGLFAGALGEFIWPRLQDYQRRRLLTFLDPDRDPLGAGYHIAQSKIALGSGGLNGRGFLGGTQSQLNFLPEKHTDFIFTMFAEETGFFGAIALIGLYALLLGWLLAMAMRSRNALSRLVIAGVGLVFAVHVFVNIGMVTGLLPVVGVPLPLVSYGGTSMLTLMFGLGLALSAHVHRGDLLRADDTGAFC